MVALMDPTCACASPPQLPILSTLCDRPAVNYAPSGGGYEEFRDLAAGRCFPCSSQSFRSPSREGLHGTSAFGSYYHRYGQGPWGFQVVPWWLCEKGISLKEAFALTIYYWRIPAVSGNDQSIRQTGSEGNRHLLGHHLGISLRDNRTKPLC